MSRISTVYNHHVLTQKGLTLADNYMSTSKQLSCFQHSFTAVLGEIPDYRNQKTPVMMMYTALQTYKKCPLLNSEFLHTVNVQPIKDGSLQHYAITIELFGVKTQMPDLSSRGRFECLRRNVCLLKLAKFEKDLQFKEE